jgi:hypothetical protein
VEAAGIEPQSASGNEGKNGEAKGQISGVCGVCGLRGRHTDDSRGIEQPRAPRNNRENAGEAILQVAKLLENQRELPAVVARRGAIDLLETIHRRLSGRTAYAVEIAIRVLGKAPARSIRGTIVAKALLEFAIAEEEALS